MPTARNRPNLRGDQNRERPEGREEEECAEPQPGRPRIPGLRVPGQGRPRVCTPEEDTGTLSGLLFHVRAQVRSKQKDLDRLHGEISYLKRREKELLAMLVRRKGNEEKR